MKKTILCLLAGVLLVSCGESKVEAFAREKCHEVGVTDEDIKSIESEKTDSMLSDSFVAFNSVRLAKAKYEHTTGKMTDDEFHAMLEEDGVATDDILHSLRYGIVVNDSLKKLQKYKNCWREVHKVTITMNSGVQKSFNVILDKDGTPMMTDGELEKKMEEHIQTLIKYEFE